MAQWGLKRFFVLPDGGVVTVLPHVDTNTFSPIRPYNTIDDIVIINASSSEGLKELVQTLREEFVGKPHQKWANADRASTQPVKTESEG